ncbi:LOW QUALITY PROTEIN: PAN domain-containing protein At5g03700-like, partial [Asparagus officinalis]|uniref:LOW QUALITY PROTEIN: PAN domain-containing protein At5g03700-like n=1 Tax=Asparagus officinalis TaxID=4686 RepID=UPI00098E7A73
SLPSPPFPWSPSASLSFNGSSLLLSDPTERSLLWSATITRPNNVTEDGYNLVLLNSSNLQIIGKTHQQILWQSFDFPSDTIVEHQNLTSKSTLFSADRRFSSRLGPTYLALYIQNLGMYWKRTALQAKARIDFAQGPIYARLDPTGFLGLYQNETAIVDVVSFDTFNAGVKKTLRRLTLEPDGNLKAYYWSGSNWVSDFAAISQTCDLPAACGPYGLCHVEGELLGFVEVESSQKCEGLCENNCSCWGALYNNVSGYCYMLHDEYPIQTVLAVGDERKIGYFKVRNLGGGNEGRKIAGLVLIVVGALAFVAGCGFTGYRVWNARRWRGSHEDEVGMMSYKDLKSSSWIEMSSDSFRK